MPENGEQHEQEQKKHTKKPRALDFLRIDQYGWKPQLQPASKCFSKVGLGLPLIDITEPKPALNAVCLGQDATKIGYTIQEVKIITNRVNDSMNEVEKLGVVDEPVKSIGAEALVSGKALYSGTVGVVEVSDGKVAVSSGK